MESLDFKPFENSIDARREIIAYEALWKKNGASFKKIASQFAEKQFGKISESISEIEFEEAHKAFESVLSESSIGYFPKAVIKDTFDYPKRLLDAQDPLEILYYEGDLTLLDDEKAIAIVGTREPTQDGVLRARKLVKELVKRDFTIVSGLARGIDTVAHETALEMGGKTIAVIGTPIGQFYPKENRELQLEIMKNHLLVSQVPFLRYEDQNPSSNRFFFPERNKTMSALTWGTVIVEAGETSGTLVQARAALHQKRKLFILNSCFEKQELSWPKKYAQKGAIRVFNMEDISNQFPDQWR